MEINSEILIKEKTSNGVLRLVMNDLKTRNALSENMMSVLMAAINEASINSSIKVVVIAHKLKLHLNLHPKHFLLINHH